MPRRRHERRLAKRGNVPIPGGIKRWLLGATELIYGRQLQRRRIPFGPLAGTYLVTRPSISLRMFFGLDEPALCRAAARLLRPGDVVYDAGAHVGYTALLFAKLIAPGGTLHAFELLPGTAALLRQTLEANPVRGWQVHEVGLGDREATLRLSVKDTQMSSVSLAASGAHTPSETCRVVRLDDYRDALSLEPPTFVKLDVEGAEVAALEGAAGTIDTARPLMVIEFHNLDLILRGQAWLEAHGYRLWTLTGRVATASDAATLARERRSFVAVDASSDDHRSRVASLSG